MASGILKLNVWVVVAVTLLLTTTPKLVSAQTYNCGVYGGGDYSQGCDLNSSGGFSDIAAEEKLLLNDFDQYFTVDGKDLVMRLGQTVYFNVTVIDTTEEHSVTLKSLGTDHAIFTFASTPNDVRINSGQTVDTDVTNDITPDITAKLTGVSGENAYVTFRQYRPMAAAIPNKDILSGQGQQSKSTSIWQYIGIAGAIGLIIFAALWAFRTKAQKQS